MPSVRTIETADLLIERSSIFKTMTDIEQGRGTRTEGAISVFHLTKGKNKGKYLVEDGYHRLFLLLLGHQTKIKAKITGYGSGISTDLAIPLNPLKINPSLKYMGLEDLADVEILEDLKTFTRKNTLGNYMPNKLLLKALARVLKASNKDGYIEIPNYSATWYHGSTTPVTKFEVNKGSGQFGKGLYLGDKDIAEFHAKGGRQGKSGQRLAEKPGYVYTIKIVGNAIKVEDEYAFYQYIVSEDETAEDAFRDWGALDAKAVTRCISKWADNNGYDIVIFDPKEKGVLTPFKQAVVINQSAIKSVSLAKNKAKASSTPTELPIAHNFKLRETKKNMWALIDPTGKEIVPNFIFMRHIKNDADPNVLSLIHPEDLPKNLKGKGLGVTSYLALSKHYGKIRSDDSLTDDGAAVWERLVDKYNAEIISWDIKDATPEQLEEWYGDSLSPKAKYDPDTYYVRYELTAESERTVESSSVPSFETLQKNKVKLTEEERNTVMKAKAVWHHGPNGEETPAVWKSKIKDKVYYVTHTHRVYQAKRTLQAAINAFHNFIKSTASLTQAGISDTVYHYTSISSAANILQENRFALTFISGSDDIHKPKNKYYYLSTTRSKIGSYHISSAENFGVLFKLNGTSLRNNYVGNPVDYWGREFRKVAPSKNEMEDRIWSDKPFIEPATKYIEEVHIYFIDVTLESLKRHLKKLLMEAKKRKIPTYIYTEEESAKVLDKRKAIPLSKIDIKTGLEEPSRSFGKFDHMAPWLELYEKDNVEHLSTEPFGGAKRRLNGFYYTDDISVFKTDIHNSKKGTPALHKIVEILKKNKWSMEDFYKYLQKKWTSKKSEGLLVTAEQTLTLWHGGNLEFAQENISHKGGRWEHGPGLYLTTHYDTARKYAKGSRKLYRIVIKQGTNITDVDIPMSAVNEFIDNYFIKSRKKDVVDRIENRIKDNKINADTFLNIVFNEQAIKNTDTDKLRDFLVKQGVDYSIVDNAFGWNERMVVLFNMRNIVSKERVTPKEKIEIYDLSTKFGEM